MTVLVIEGGRPSLRGGLTRWMLEIRAGVFVGTLSARVRDHLWAMVVEKLDGGNAVLAWEAPNEQGFALRTAGDSKREIFDIDGLTMVVRKVEERAKAGAANG